MMYDRARRQMPARSGHASRVLTPPSRPGEAWRERSSAGSVPSSARAGFDFARMPMLPATTATPGSSARSASKCACGGSCPKCANPTGESSSGPEPMTSAPAPQSGGVSTADADGGDAGAVAAPADAGAVADAGVGLAPVAPARLARLKSGPTYTPHGNVAPAVAGGFKNVPFVFDAEFDHAPADGVFPSCGEIHQDIKWDAAARTNGNAAWGLNTPHGGFPAAHPANTWIEDRDAPGTFRYGHRRGPFATAVAGGNEYHDAAGIVNMGTGPIYHGRDNPSGVPAAFHGRWTFMVLAFDMCNRGTQIGSADFIVIDW